MSSRSYSIETRSQAAMIIGGSDLAPSLIAEFKARGIYALAPTSLADFAFLRKTHDLDYLLIFSDHETSSWLAWEGKPFLESLQSLIQTGPTRLILARHYSVAPIDLPLSPTSLELLYSDYLGDSAVVSPILNSWSLTLKQDHSLHIPGDGLAEIGILSQPDLVKGLVEGITRPHSQLGGSLLLTSIESISLLNLAYDLRSHLSFKVKIVFDADTIPPSDLPPSTISRLLWDQTTKLDAIVSSFGKTIVSPAVASPVVVPTISLPLPAVASAKAGPKLSRLAYPSPVFVPLHPPRHSSPYLISRLKRHLARPSLQFSTSRPKLRPRTIIGRGLLIALGIYLGSLAFATTISGLFLRQIVRSISLNSLPPSSTLVATTTTYLEANLVTLSLLPLIGRSPLIQDSLLLLDSYQQTLVILDTSESLAQTTYPPHRTPLHFTCAFCQ
ncbi:MAG: hypothetical protein UX62_C0050G0005 [Microgenomates group bacterium GW2011_GWA2_46_7]|nr:MAG: hypothetical protein UX62_C0050G0005 [Microgenomates group bacterium GW2011_GWA2_46_7]